MSKRVTVIVEGREYIVEVGDLEKSPITATVNKRTYRVEVPQQAPGTGTPPAGEVMPASQSIPAAKKASPSAPAAASTVITAPMPGKIMEVKVKAGDNVQPGDVICVLEAMKMNNMIRTSHGGVIASVAVTAGQSVDYGAILATFE